MLGSPRQPRFERPALTLVTPAPRFFAGCREVPFPPALGPLLRPECPARHYAAALSAICNGAARDTLGGPRHGDWMQTFCRARELLLRNCTDDRLAPLLAALLSVRPCRCCGRSLLAETSRRQHCSDHCRRTAADGRARTGRQRDPASGRWRHAV